MGIQGGSILCVALICMHLCLHRLMHMWAVSVGMCVRVYSFMSAQVPFHMNANVCVVVYVHENVKLSMYLHFCGYLHKSIP